MTLPGLLQTKVVLARHGRTIAAVLCVVFLLSLAGAGWWATHPPTTTVTDHTHERTVATDLETSALVTSDSALYDRGDRLSNQQVYFREATPNLTVRLQTDVTPGDNPAVVDQRLALVTRVTRDDEVFWERTRPLADDRAEVSDGNATTAATLSIARLEREGRPVREEVGPVGEVSLFVRVVVQYETDRYEGTVTRLVPVRIGSHSYSLSPATLSTTESTPVDRQVPVPDRDPLPGAAMGVLGLLGLVGAVTGFSVERRVDAAVAAERLDRQRFEEWISTGRIGPDLGEQYVSLASLGDLVDVGIDANRRVIHDPETGTYAVIDDKVVYHYGHAASSMGPGDTDSELGPATSHPAATTDSGADDSATTAPAEETGSGMATQADESVRTVAVDPSQSDSEADAADPDEEFEWPVDDE